MFGARAAARAAARRALACAHLNHPARCGEGCAGFAWLLLLLLLYRRRPACVARAAGASRVPAVNGEAVL